MGVYGCTPIFGKCPLYYNKGLFVAKIWIIASTPKHDFPLLNNKGIVIAKFWISSLSCIIPISLLITDYLLNAEQLYHRAIKAVQNKIKCLIRLFLFI